MDDMSEIKPGILEMIQEEQRVSPLKSNSVVRAFLKFIFHILKIHYYIGFGTVYKPRRQVKGEGGGCSNVYFT